MQKQVNDVLLDDVTMMVTYTAKTLLTYFNTRHKAVINHEYDIVYYANCPKESCSCGYVVESGSKVLEQIKGHYGIYH